MNKMPMFPINSEEKELCCLCALGLVHYDYLTPSAKELYDTLTEKDKKEIQKVLDISQNRSIM